MNDVAKKILVVDDEPKIVEVVTSYLKDAGYLVCEALNGRQALEVFGKESLSLVILDLMLPDITGEDICNIIRKKSKVPIIMLTAKIEENDILKGLSIGADDYITKPFSPRQLIARVKAVLRRTEEDAMSHTDIVSYNNNDLIIDYKEYDVKKNGVSVNLTPNEFKLLQIMIKYPKKIFTRDELISLAMSEDFEGYDRVIDTHIKNIRQKIETNPKSPQYILTVHGVGYRFKGDLL
jgi:DNA-binding response OmpR family regulator